ncbi:MAG TPA: hypothetical protein DCG19_04895 [Cryomorphaceae bacterium]|mgnify:CR=1 FL=1|nr:hypothetical protein [Owenweeksia sp.]MBG00406.1 hypothetical protein [Owenweeksia sp.]HAD96720.1 hypothetical protein [Cryomorphaceae bacterium]HBF21612.1 hypothetical protein [Cryomorphaceae bacterium]HCQ16514.1 hypothetical protein [Cryomorphaceae bacterium]|tara:strand:+ start:211 stop:585 length:375 start_codon:yes stop_codon:yes gene_type:complete
MEEQEVQSLLTCINSNLEYFPLTWDYRLQFTIGFFGGPQLRFELDSEKMYNLILANAQDEMIIPIHTKTNNFLYIHHLYSEIQKITNKSIYQQLLNSTECVTIMTQNLGEIIDPFLEKYAVNKS